MRETLIDKPEIEYIGGRAYPKVSPKRTHSMVQRNLLRLIEDAAGDRGVVGPEWRFKLEPDTSLVPDIAYVSFKRLRALTDEQAEEPPFAPDVVGEVRSPSHRAGLLASKIEHYLSHGAILVLDVDPAQRMVYAHTPDETTAYKSGERFACDAVPWLRFDVEALFAGIDIPR